jgi:hypothetical protein
MIGKFFRRLYRVVWSRHVRDLLIIAILGFVAVFYFVWTVTDRLYLLTTESKDFDTLDRGLNAYFSMVICEEKQSDNVINSKKSHAINKDRDDLVITRSKLTHIDRSRWGYINDTIARLTQQTDDVRAILAANVYPPHWAPASKATLAGINSNKGESEFNELQMALDAQISLARHLNSALSLGEDPYFNFGVLSGLAAGIFTFLAWFYRTSDSRLTSVDMIAGEIHSLCRAMTNNQTADGMVRLYFVETENLNIERLKYVEIQEEYNQVMTTIGSSLGFLDQTTITRIMGFHTSLKMLRDQF